MAEKLSIDERLALLEEAENFFADLSASGERNERLWHLKAAGIGTVKECLELFQNKILEWKEWTEDTLEQWLLTVIEEDYVKDMEEIHKLDEEEKVFYEGWFGLAIWIMKNEDETIDWYKEIVNQYDKIVEIKGENRTIADLLK